jgi:predicted DsbA family dithiol-disulfide isomerase
VVERKAYFLHPEIPPEGRPRELRDGESADDTSLSEPLKSLAEDCGLIMRRAKKTPFTRTAQAATEYAKQFDVDEAFYRAAYREFWDNGADLGDYDVLESLSLEVGLDWSDLKPRLEAGEFDLEIQNQHDEAMKVGIWGVPGFVVDDGFYFTGAQPIEMFRLAVKRALDARKSGTAEGFGGIVIGEG